MSGFGLFAADLAQAALAFLIYPLFLLPVGWLAGEASGLAGFREGSLRLRLALSLVLGVAVAPVLAYLVTRAAGFTGTWALFASAGAAFFILLARRRARPAGTLLLPWQGLLLALVLAAGYAMMADVPLGDGLSVHSMTFDKGNHTAVIDAIARTGVPPANPYFHPGEPQALFYYYFWFLVGALVDLAGGGLVGPRAANQAGTLWSGLALVAMILVWTRHLSRELERPPRYGLVLLLLLVTGLDLLALATLGVVRAKTGLGPGIPANPEWWNEQVTAWPAAVLWVPHHVAGLVACMGGFLALRGGLQGSMRTAVAALAFASAAGLSVWVTLTAALGTGAWVAFSLVRGRWRDEALPALLAGLGALVLAAPFLFDLATAQSLKGAPMAFEVREFWPLTRMDEWFGINRDCGGACRLAALPLNYALEFGLFFFAVSLFWRRARDEARQSRDAAFLTTVAVTALLLATFVRSDISANDLGWRSLMFLQLMLLWWTAPVLANLGSKRWGRLLLMTALVIGLLGTAGDLLRLRLWPAEAADLDLRQAYAWIDRNTPSDAIIQHNPDRHFEPFHALHAHRQTVAADRHYGTLFGVNPRAFGPVFLEMALLFDAGTLPGRVRSTVERFGIDVLVVGPEDGAWDDPGGWTAGLGPRFANEHARVYFTKDLEQNPAQGR